MKLAIIIASALLLTACPPRTQPGTSTSSGAGGAASSSSSAESSSTSTATSGGADAGLDPRCTTPRPRDLSYRCSFDTDCYAHSPCMPGLCREGGCVYEPRTDGARCDAGAFRGVCQAGACCPPAETPATPIVEEPGR